MDNTEKLRYIVEERCKKENPEYPVRIEELEEEESGFALAVFSVPREKDSEIEDFILDLDQELCGGTENFILPLIRDPQVTAQFYPEMALKASINYPAMALETSLKEGDWSHDLQPIDSIGEDNELAEAA